MKIVVANKGFLYSLMCDIYKRDVDSSESWRGGVSADDSKKKISGVKFDPCELPYPLDYSGLIVKRIGEFYSAGFIVKARRQGVFHDLSEKLREPFSGIGMVWHPTHSNGSGYILSSPTDKIIIASIIEHEELVRSIGFGTNGAHPRRLDKEEPFIQGMRELEQIGTIFVNCCYSEDERKKNDVLQTLKGLVS